MRDASRNSPPLLLALSGNIFVIAMPSMGVHLCPWTFCSAKKARCWSFVRLLTSCKTMISVEPMSLVKSDVLKSGSSSNICIPLEIFEAATEPSPLPVMGLIVYSLLQLAGTSVILSVPSSPCCTSSYIFLSFCSRSSAYCLCCPIFFCAM
jgi:hypothetical protein